ncbi:MAG: hypothetical protein H6705_19305 [Myxococcales bacterium]|nr:hypothetical protein [Myxococcales bacterium]
MNRLLAVLTLLLAHPAAAEPEARYELQVVAVHRPLDLEGRFTTGPREVYLQPIGEPRARSTRSSARPSSSCAPRPCPPSSRSRPRPPPPPNPSRAADHAPARAARRPAAAHRRARDPDAAPASPPPTPPRDLT